MKYIWKHVGVYDTQTYLGYKMKAMLEPIYMATHMLDDNDSFEAMNVGTPPDCSKQCLFRPCDMSDIREASTEEVFLLSI